MYSFLLNFFNIPIKLIKPENCINVPNCSAAKTYPIEIITSPAPANK